MRSWLQRGAQTHRYAMPNRYATHRYALAPTLRQDCDHWAFRAYATPNVTSVDRLSGNAGEPWRVVGGGWPWKAKQLGRGSTIGG